MKEIVTIKGKPVIEIYESVDGSYWFITEKCFTQDSLISGKIYKKDQILFGFVRLAACPEGAEWGYISEAELKLLGSWVWKVPRTNWPVCPLVEVRQEENKGPGEMFSPPFEKHIQKNERGCLQKWHGDQQDF